MQLVNYSQQTLHAADPVVTTITPQRTTESPGFYLKWLPGLALALAILSIGMLGSPTNSSTELDWLSQLANKGDSGAQLLLGLAYRDGHYGIEADPKTALYWLKQSAAGGNAFAEDAIGTAYASGAGTGKDIQQAEQWWRKAIKDGNPNAKIHLVNTLIQDGHPAEADKLLM